MLEVKVKYKIHNINLYAEINNVFSTELKFKNYRSRANLLPFYHNYKQMNGNYKFHNPKGLYFVSFTVVKWL